MSVLGTTIAFGFDAEGHERRKQLVATCECVRCGKEVDLWGETDSWIEGEEGKWLHNGYDPGWGECCGLIYAGDFEGVQVLNPAGALTPEERSRCQCDDGDDLVDYEFDDCEDLP